MHWTKWSRSSAIEHTRPTKSVVIEIPEGMNVLTQRYLSDRQKEITLFQEALGKSDFAKAGSLANNLKGIGTSFGFAEVTALEG